MKPNYLFLALLCAWPGHAAGRVWTDEERGREAGQAALWSGKLEAAASLESGGKLESLARGLRNMGHRRTIPEHSPEIDRAYRGIQQTLLSLPGHAEYFADLIEKERAALKPEQYRGDYDRHRYWLLRDTLRHLPSPETVRVLGRYLEDDRDTYPPPPPGSDSGIDPPNSIIAMESLLLLELRDAPYPPGRWYWYRSTKELATVRAWFAPIKSGQRTFSFRGQAVEYRFNPDGTWVSNAIANPPVDPPYPPRPKPPGVTPAPKKSPAAPTTQANHPALWPWLGGVLIVVLGILIWQIKARCARKSP